MARTHRRLSQATGQLQEKEDHAVSPADPFTTSEELAREERNESWDERIQAEQHQARSLS